MIIRLSLLANNEDLSIKCLDLIKHLGLGVTLEPSADYNFKAQYRRMCYADADIVIGIDEDCFIANPEVLLDISEYMIMNRVPYLAMQETSGVSGHRKTAPNATEKDYNSFLMFTQPKLIRPYMADGKTIIEKQMTDKWIEPYWTIFRYLYDAGCKGESFKGYDHPDGITTLLTWEDKIFAVHTWFARSYTHHKKDEYGINQNKRINDRYKEVKDACS